MSTLKRRRTDAEEACEALGGLLRQTAARAVERVRHLRQQRSAAAGGGVGGSILSTSAGEAVMRAAKPMDVLVIRFCVHYLDCSSVAGPTQFVRLAQSLVTSSVERVLVPQLFAKGNGSLPALCEALVAEHSADDIQTAVKEIYEFVEARGALGAWLAEASENGGPGDEDEYDDEIRGGGWDHLADDRPDDYDALRREEEGADEGAPGAARAAKLIGDPEEQGPLSLGEDFGLASVLYKACEFWVRVQAFLNALSLHSARLHVFKMPPRYERELLQLLYSATRGADGEAALRLGEGPATPSGSHDSGVATERSSLPIAISSATASASAKREEDVVVKREPAWSYEEDGEATEANVDFTTVGNEDERVNDEAQPSSPQRPPQQLYKASALLADVLALSRCPEVAPSNTSTSTSTPSISAAEAPTPHLQGINPVFYKMVYARLGVMVARDRLHRFDQLSTVAPPELNVQQRNLQTQLLQQQQLESSVAATAATGLAESMEAGLPTSYVPDDAYFDKLLHQQHDAVEEDEEVYKGEVMDYYLSHPGRHAATAAAGAATSRSRQHGGNRGNSGSGDGETPLMKPHRFCKVKTGFSWTQYNRTHYDSRTNPPPRTEMWYEFTLFYPALANTKRDMRHIFRIEDAPEGPNDQYCLLVFSVGPPYADVAYRIRKKQWDTRRGGVRISFDQTGRYKLFFRFTNSNYRR